MHRLTLRGPLSWSLLLLLVILLVALSLRLYGVNWDDGFGFHPDERDIYMRSGCMYDVLAEKSGYRGCGYLQSYPQTVPGIPGPGVFLDADRSPLNPHWFPLGSILIYVMVAFRFGVERFTEIGALDMRYVGRPLSALADVGSVFMVYLLGRRMYSRGVGLLAAALTALAVIHIQNSHFYRPETFSVLFTLASFWAMLRMVERKRLRDSALLGLLVGFALAPKVNILPLALPLALAYGYRVMDSVDGQWYRVTPRLVQGVLVHAGLAVLIAVSVFIATSPYAILDFRAFIAGLAGQVDMARHAGTLPFTIQYIDTPAFWYQIRQTTLWGLGLPLGIVAWLAVPFTAVVALAQRQHLRADLLLLAWVVPSFLLLESFEVRFLRYVFPLMPFMILMGARMLLWLVSQARQLPRRHGESAHIKSVALRLGGLFPAFWWLSVVMVALVVAATAFYTLAFQRVYASDHPAVAASRWINENVPRRTSIISDNHWDEYVPDLYRYDVWQFPVYNEPDSVIKMGELAQRLEGAEYLVFYSNRPYSSVARAPARYPRSNAYYRLLFGGKLGYRLERRFSSYPELLGVSFQDDPFKRAGLPRPEPLVPGRSSLLSLNLGYADDNVVGYDHPQVLLFRNQEHLPESTLRRLLLQTGPDGPPSPPVGLMMTPEEKARQRAGGTWSDIIHRDSWTNRLPVLAWLLIVELVYLATLPLAMFVFRPLPDRGIVLARILGLLGVSYVGWLIVSLGWVGFSQTSFFLGLLAVACLSAFVLLGQWTEIKRFLYEHWRRLLAVEALFLIAFLAFVALRAANPDLWEPWRGGEKPMELAYLNAVVRSTSLPPFDPWFAGGYMNYYYWGYFVLGGLIRVTGILPNVAFNLAVPLFFALTVTGAYSLVYNLAEGVRRSRVPAPSSASVIGGGAGRRVNWPALWTPTAAGLMAGLFTAVIGNLHGVIQIFQGTWHKLADGQAFPVFSFWNSSRMIPDLENIDPSPLVFWVPDRIPGFPEVSPHITEFPFFTFLFADLHAHMMVLPFTLLVIGLGMSLVVGLRRNGPAWPIAPAAFLALALGALWVINSWDYPSYLLLTLAMLGLAVYFLPGPPLGKTALLAILGTSVVALSVVAFLPFHQSYETFQAGIEASKWQTPIDRYLGIHGLFLFVIATFLIYQTRHTWVQMVRSLTGGRLPAVDVPLDLQMTRTTLSWLKVALVAGLILVVFLAAGGFWTAALLLVLMILTGVAGREVLASGSEDRPFLAVPLLLLGMALAIGIGVDLVRLEGDIGRMNTLFKYYLEAWMLLGLASAYMLWHLGSQGFFRSGWAWAKGLWLVMLLLLIGSSLVYTGLGTKARLADRFNPGPLTLDGTSYMQKAVHFQDGQPIELKWDLEAIQWLQDNVAGSPVVLEAHGVFYRWNSRIADYTGLPTLLGWPWHQTQQRMAYDYTVRDRAAAVREIYNTTSLDRTKELLLQYEVKYIVVGELERIYYSQEGIRKFSKLADAGFIEPVFQNEGVLIYRSNR